MFPEQSEVSALLIGCCYSGFKITWLAFIQGSQRIAPKFESRPNQLTTIIPFQTERSLCLCVCSSELCSTGSFSVSWMELRFCMGH